MIATLSLMSCVLATAQPADRSEWLLLPRLSRAEELVYRGSFDEQANGSAVEFKRSYRFQNVVFVLDATPQEAEVSFLTILRQRTSPTARTEEALPSSVRLEVARVGAQGKVTGDAAALAVPLEGPPTAETEAVVEVPRRRVGLGATWAAGEDNRPTRTWTVAGTDTVNATTCVKLVGVQKSDDWDRPRGDHTAWWRQDTVWVAPRFGIAYRVKREIKRREPLRQEPTYSSVLVYELDQRSEYPRSISDAISRQITQTRAFAGHAAPLLPAPTRYTAQIDGLLERIKYHQEHYPAPPPYGEAMRSLQRRLEAARRGEAAPTPPAPDAASAGVAAVGLPAPDFLVPDYTAPESARLRRWKGKPVLMIFYSPHSTYAEEVLRLGQEVHDRGRGTVAVLGMAVGGSADAVRKQGADLRLTFPLIDGTGLRQSYDVGATPKLMVLDADGFVRGAWVGWGGETRPLVLQEIKAQQNPPSPVKP
jgi:peroxiredoxin